MPDWEQWQKELPQPTVTMERAPLSLRPSPVGSVYGAVAFAAPGERWPRWRNRPLRPLCQLNLEDLDHRPECLDDVALMTVFIAAGFERANGSVLVNAGAGYGAPWCVRTYETLDMLVPLTAPRSVKTIDPFLIRWRSSEAKRRRAPAVGTIGGGTDVSTGALWWHHEPEGDEFDLALSIVAPAFSNAGLVQPRAQLAFARSLFHGDKWAFDWRPAAAQAPSSGANAR